MSSGEQTQNTASSKLLLILMKDAENNKNSDYQRNKSHHGRIWKNSSVTYNHILLMKQKISKLLHNPNCNLSQRPNDKMGQKPLCSQSTIQPSFPPSLFPILSLLFN